MHSIHEEDLAKSFHAKKTKQNKAKEKQTVLTILAK